MKPSNLILELMKRYNIYDFLYSNKFDHLTFGSIIKPIEDSINKFNEEKENVKKEMNITEVQCFVFMKYLETLLQLSYISENLLISDMKKKI